MDYIKLPRADDMHVHLRQGVTMSSYAKTVEQYAGRAVVMPNTLPPITTPRALDKYRGQITKAAPHLMPLMTFKLVSGMEPDLIQEIKQAGAVAGKLYPEGVTTNSEDGVRDIAELYPVFSSMEQNELVLCLHGESPNASALERETAFFPVVEDIARNFINLRIVFEHVSTADGVDFIGGLPDTVAATVTVHHLLFTLDDMVADGLNPHLYCKPLLKNAADRASLQEKVLAGDPRFFFGTDSAPHPRSAKEGPLSAAGVYSAPVAVPLLIDFFESSGNLGGLESFIAAYGADFYGLSRSIESIRWARKPWRVPSLIDGAVPLCAGKRLSWQLDSD